MKNRSETHAARPLVKRLRSTGSTRHQLADTRPFPDDNAARPCSLLTAVSTTQLYSDVLARHAQARPTVEPLTSFNVFGIAPHETPKKSCAARMKHQSCAALKRRVTNAPFFGVVIYTPSTGSEKASKRAVVPPCTAVPEKQQAPSGTAPPACDHPANIG